VSAWDYFWAWAQTNLGSNVVGGLFVALVVAVVGLILTIVRKTWRAKIWGSVERFFKWLGGVRPTTAASRERDYEERRKAEETAEEEARVQHVLDNVQFKLLDLDADRERRANLTPPRWSLARVGNKQYTLANGSSAAVARDVVLSAPVDRFTFLDDARWDVVEAEEIKSFRGKPHGPTASKGLMIKVEWRDEVGRMKSADVFLDREPIVPPRIY